MKKFCNKISHQQWRVTVPNLNTTIFRKSTSSSEIDNEKKRVSSGSYDLPAAQREYDLHGSTARSQVTLHSGSSSTGSYEDARQDNEQHPETPDVDLYDIVDIHETVKVMENKTLSTMNNKYEYDVPKIQFSFIEDKTRRNSEKAKVEAEVTEEQVEVHNYENAEKPKRSTLEKDPRTKVIHKSQLQIVVTNVIDLNDGDMGGHPVIKFGSDPNLNLLRNERGANAAIDDDENDGECDEFYKVPRRIHNQNRLSKSLHDFNMDELNLPPLALSSESIEHVSCSQVLPVEREESISPQNSTKKGRRRKWQDFKSKFNRVIEEHASHQRVGAFAEKEKIVINIEDIYKTSKDKCKRIFKHTGKIFKRNSGAHSAQRQRSHDTSKSGDTESQIVKNDAFFAKIKASDIEYVLPKRQEDASANVTEESEDAKKDSEAETHQVNESDSDTKTPSVDNTNNAKNIERVQSPDTSGSEYKDYKMLEWSRKRISGAIADEVAQMKNGFRKSRLHLEGQNGFEDLRRYVKQGGDFCKELGTILQERSEAELQYSKSLSKLSTKLSRACREGVGGLNEAWKAVALELESRAEAHRCMSNVLLEEAAKPLKIMSENQHRQRKTCEAMVDKAAKLLSEWRSAEAKSKKHSHACARDNEKLQDAMLDNRMSRSTSLIQLPNIHKTNSDKDTAKLEGKKRKAEDAVKKADIEYYSHCVRSERARLEWESAVIKGASTFQTLEEERLSNLKTTLSSYIKHNTDLSPKIEDGMLKLRGPVDCSDAQKDLTTFLSLRQSSQQTSEQLLPDFYCEHITLAMNRERRKQALVKLLQLIKLDIEREKKSKDGLENLSKAIKQTPNFGSEDSQQTVAEKLYHMKSMLTYLEGAKYKVQNALAELDCRPRTGHPLASHITITRDKAGLQQSILKAPLWLREQWREADETKIDKIDSKDGDYDVENNWIDRGMADGNSNQHDSDFDEFSSQDSSSSICGVICTNEETAVVPIAHCKVLYSYTPNLPDELAIHPGDKVVVYRQQEDGWWLGECNGSVGIFPATYVETLKT